MHDALCGVSGWINGVCYLFAEQILASILYIGLRLHVNHLLLSSSGGVWFSS